MPMDTRVDTYIASRNAFAKPILDHLRRLVHTQVPSVKEGIKWGMPFFSYGERPLANMAAFKAHATFGFWNRPELSMGKEGEAMGQLGRLTDLASMPPDADIMRMIGEAVARIDAGVKPSRAAKSPKPDAEVPAILADALAGDDKATAKWHAFSPSCRREYCEWVADAKRDATRAKRVATTIAQAREGKKLNWKYENC